MVAEPGQSPTDFIAIAGFGPTLANMGLWRDRDGLRALAVGGELNGPVIGAIFTIVGFAAFGKHPRNIVPIMIGVFIGSLPPWGRRAGDPARGAVRHDAGADRRALRLALGIVAGFIHSSAALTVGTVHAGLNLYNNGFAAGIVASIPWCQ